MAFGTAFFRQPVAPSNRDVKVGPIVRRVATSSGVLRREDRLEFEAHFLVGHHGRDIAIPSMGYPNSGSIPTLALSPTFIHRRTDQSIGRLRGRRGHTIHLAVVATPASRQSAANHALLVEDVQVPPLHRFDMVVIDNLGARADAFLRPQPSNPSSHWR